MGFLEENQWRSLAEAHRARVAPTVEAHRARKSRGEKHAVLDFLWEYYSFRPAQLEKWSAGAGVVLENGARCGMFSSREYSQDVNDAWLDARNLPAARREALLHIAQLLEKTAAHPPFLGCFGLHEWAMLYRCDTARHAQLPLRLSPRDIENVVEESGVRCTHFDAFRFFTPDAAPLNLLPLRRETQSEFEQPGCLHANMDLYKWAHKFSPFIGSEIVFDTFELARDARVLDMRATPYDLSDYDLAPVKIETPAGRREYSQMQRDIAVRAAPLRARVLAAYRALIVGTKTATVR